MKVTNINHVLLRAELTYLSDCLPFWGDFSGDFSSSTFLLAPLPVALHSASCVALSSAFSLAPPLTLHSVSPAIPFSTFFLPPFVVGFSSILNPSTLSFAFPAALHTASAVSPPQVPVLDFPLAVFVASCVGLDSLSIVLVLQAPGFVAPFAVSKHDCSTSEIQKEYRKQN